MRLLPLVELVAEVQISEREHQCWIDANAHFSSQSNRAKIHDLTFAIVGSLMQRHRDASGEWLDITGLAHSKVSAKGTASIAPQQCMVTQA